MTRVAAVVHGARVFRERAQELVGAEGKRHQQDSGVVERLGVFGVDDGRRPER